MVEEEVRRVRVGILRSLTLESVVGTQERKRMSYMLSSRLDLRRQGFYLRLRLVESLYGINGRIRFGDTREWS